MWQLVFKLKYLIPYSVRIRKNADQKNYEYGHISQQVLTTVI